MDKEWVDLIVKEIRENRKEIALLKNKFYALVVVVAMISGNAKDIMAAVFR